MAIKSYKGFNKDMTCRDFQYEEGKEYSCEKAEICRSGFHACTMPLDILKYYNPINSVYYEVEQDGDLQYNDKDSKVASTKIKIGSKIDLKELIKTHIDLIFEKIDKIKDKKLTSENNNISATSRYFSTSVTSDDNCTSVASGYKSTSTSNGYFCTSVTSGDYSVSTSIGCRTISASSGDHSTSVSSGNSSISATSGNRSTSATSGNHNVSITSGDYSTSASSGDYCTSSTSGEDSVSATSGCLSTSIASGDESISASSGYMSISVTSGNFSTSATTGDYSTAIVKSPNSIAVASGYHARAKGVKGSYLVLTDYGNGDNLAKAIMIQIDDITYKADTYYTIDNHEVIEADTLVDAWRYKDYVD